MNAIRSMTGFARARRASTDVEVVVSVKSVNHRGLDVHFHTPPELDAFENAMRAAVKERLTRGHIDLRVSVHRTAGASPLSINQPMLAAYLAAFRQAAEEHGVDSEPDLNAAFRIPGMLADADEEPDPEFEKILIGALQDALEALNRFREREGGELAAVIREHAARISSAADQIERIREKALPAFQVRLSDRLTELLGGAPGLDPQRLAQEAAVLADRSDIGEEIARLRIHSRQLDQLMVAGGEAGKKLDFLLQEMNRETNTILSKTGGIGELGMGITEIALAAKADIERVREQSLNLE